ncbi:galactose-specific lectin nattectin-like [Clarias gariepinus]
MKVWIVCILLCAAFTLRTATPAAIETEPEQNQKLPGETTELAAEEVIEAAEDKVEALKLDADAEGQNNDCPFGWIKYGSRCFRLMRSSQAWVNADAQCVVQQARLASVQNVEENNFLQGLLDMADVYGAWTGGYHFQRVWFWVDAARFQYTNWFMLINQENLPCVLMRRNGGWYTAKCSTDYPFICSIDLPAC